MFIIVQIQITLTIDYTKKEVWKKFRLIQNLIIFVKPPLLLKVKLKEFNKRYSLVQVW